MESFHNEIKNLMKEKAPSFGPINLKLVNPFYNKNKGKSTAIVEGYKGGTNPVKTQWKLYYDGNELKSVEIPESEWL